MLFSDFSKALKTVRFYLVSEPFFVYIIFVMSVINYSQMLAFLTELLTFLRLFAINLTKTP